MCVVSMIGDDFTKRWPHNPNNPFDGYLYPTEKQITREEFEALKKEIEALKKLLEAGKKYDEETNQPNCHMDEKVELIKKLAELVGVDVSDVFK